MKELSVMKEVAKLTGVKKEKKTNDKFKVALAKAANDLDQKVWDKLPDEITDWVEEVLEAEEEGEDLPDDETYTPDDEVDNDKDEDDEEEQEDDSKGEKVIPIKKNTKAAKKVEKKAPKKAAKKERKKTERKPKVFTKKDVPAKTTDAIRWMVGLNPDATQAEIKELLSEKGLDVNKQTLNVTYNCAQTMIQVIRQLKIKL